MLQNPPFTDVPRYKPAFSSGSSQLPMVLDFFQVLDEESEAIRVGCSSCSSQLVLTIFMTTVTLW
jgi:hypothetical protein